VGRIDGSLDGLSIRPTANQQLSQTIVVVNLKHAPHPDAEVDENLLSDFRNVTTLKE
jgi:hypothetical protein